ncbi:MAG: hypothetical protein ACYC69_02715 [Thermodesulfovibrionales bacterium]
MDEINLDNFKRRLNADDDRPEVLELFGNIKTKLPELEKLLQQVNDHWGYEDMLYRYYHRSFKVYSIQNLTEKIVGALRSLLPGRELDSMFLDILRGGSGKEFEWEHNQRWEQETRPLLEAFFHSRYFLEMAIKYGKTMEKPTRSLPSGWAALLSLYRLR